MSSNAGQGRDHALVIGGSMAGLLAARVLSDHFKRVTIIERDPINDQPESRKGQPQTRHLHAVLANGYNIIKKHFPDIEQRLTDGGALVGDMGEMIRWYHYDGYKAQHTSGLEGIALSRPFLEWHVRCRVTDLPNVTQRPACAVTGLVASADQTQITGVEITDRDNDNSTETIEADLVMDASGRGSAGPKWLADLGYEAPSAQEVKINVGYATRIYRRGPDHLEEPELVMISPTPPAGKQGAFLFPIEDDRWILTAAGIVGHHPPDDEAGFLECIRNLPVSDIYDIISQTEPLSDIVTHKFPASLRRHYQKLERFPGGYLVIGDAIASLNPIYGQGMTSAAMQTEVLDDELRRGEQADLWRSYFKRVAGVVDLPWQLTVGEDFRYPETEGEKPPGTDLINAYVARVHRAAHHDAAVYSQFLRVMNLLDPPTSLMHPRFWWSVMRS